MARKRNVNRRKKNLGTAGKIVIGVALGAAAIYGLAWTGYLRHRLKSKAPAGTPSLPDGNEPDGQREGFAWHVRYDASKAPLPYAWSIDKGDMGVSGSSETYADARASIMWAIDQENSQ